jgi:hypothetical protein
MAPESRPKFIRFISFRQRGQGLYRTRPTAGAPNAGPTRGSRAWDPNAAAALGWPCGAADDASEAFCRIADCPSRSAHRRSKAADSIHVPSQRLHSSRSTSPTRTHRMWSRHPGHLIVCCSGCSDRLRAAPQYGQKAAPSNSRPKQTGQPTVASCAWQYSHRAASGVAGAPQLGHRSVEGSRLMAHPRPDDTRTGGTTTWE